MINIEKYGVGLNHLPSGRFAANGAWLAVQVMAHNLARWTARIGLGEQIAPKQDIPVHFSQLTAILRPETQWSPKLDGTEDRHWH